MYIGEEKDPSGTSRLFSNFLYLMNFEKSKSVLVDKVNLLLENVDPKGIGAVAHHFRPIAVLTEGPGLICSPYIMMFFVAPVPGYLTTSSP